MENVIAIAFAIIAAFAGTAPAHGDSEVTYTGQPKWMFAAGPGRVEQTATSQLETPPPPLAFTVKNGTLGIWTSRNNQPLLCSESGAFVTCLCVGGCGYIRFFTPSGASSWRSLGGDLDYDYVEHVTNMLGSLTYYGKILAREPR